VHDRNALALGKFVDSLDVRLTDLAKRNRRRELKLPLPAQEDTHLSDRLKLGYIGLQEDSVDGTALERHVVSQ